ncbi:phosphatidate cytidylyltransferase [Agarivorans aestuarii]|uniref:phosphatidate cytidylyltransferase n=1 Tax=Agarivorans aestuarii TaxID=1563703 RepID=UPI001C7F6CB8|nr:phosphatidate cytidylyltransferase [Agarivorans aestuarii]
MLKQRIITALILAPLALAAIFMLPLFGLAVVFALVLVLAAREWARVVSDQGSRRLSFFVVFSLVFGLSLWQLPLDSLAQSTWFSAMLGFAVVAWLSSLYLLSSYPHSAMFWHNSSVFKLLVGLVVLLPFFWSLVFLRSVDPSNPAVGGAWVLYVLLLVWAADTGAYFAGKRFGKRKLAKNVSPKKTIEGLLGGLAVAALVTVGAFIFLDIPEGKEWVLVIASGFTVLASVVGDLVESMFKRQAGIKDSGSLLPGHGGLLDRIDSMTAAMPVFAFFFLHWM